MRKGDGAMKCGIVDVGSNTIRLSIYHWEGQTFKLLMNKKEMAGLAGYIKNGVLSDSGILVACRVLAGFKALLRNFDIDQLYVFGTASLRNIVNTEEALETIQAVTDLQVEVLTGAEEAAFSFQGATVGGGAPGCGLLADIGGGSTELVAYRDNAITSGCSLPMGSLSLFTRACLRTVPHQGGAESHPQTCGGGTGEGQDSRPAVQPPHRCGRHHPGDGQAVQRSGGGGPG